MYILLNIIGIIFIILWLWLIYEVWRAPLMKEKEDGTYTTIRKEKKLKDVFKKK